MSFLGELWEGFTAVLGKAVLVTIVIAVILIVYAVYDDRHRDELVLAGHDVTPLSCTTSNERMTVTLASETFPGWSVNIIDNVGHRGRHVELVTPRHTFVLDHANCRTLEVHPFLAGSKEHASGTLALECTTADGDVSAKLSLSRCRE